MLFKKTVQAFDGSIEGLGIDVVVGDGIQVLVSNLDVASSLLGQDGVALDEEGVAQLVVSIVPQT